MWISIKKKLPPPLKKVLVRLAIGDYDVAYLVRGTTIAQREKLHKDDPRRSCISFHDQTTKRERELGANANDYPYAFYTFGRDIFYHNDITHWSIFRPVPMTMLKDIK